MKNPGYEESEKEMSFSEESRKGQALRIMEALSAADEELLERSDNGGAQKILPYKKGRNGESGTGETHERNDRKPRRYVKPWAAVLGIAVVGALGWGGYRLTKEVNDMPSGGSRNEMAVRLESAELQADGEGAAPEAAPEEAGVAAQAAEDMEAEKADDRTSQENTACSDMGADANGADTADSTGNGSSGMSQRESGEEENSGALPGTGMKPENASQESAKENVITDSDACLPVNQQKLTEAEARSQEGVGAYIPEKVPGGYTFESAFCDPDRPEANVTITWTKGMDSIMWTVTEAEQVPETVDIEAAETYDKRLYEIPYAETVPQEYRQSMDNPTFAWEDFTLETVRSRMISYADRGDTDTPRGNFAVLYPDNIVVKFNGRGTAEEIWEMFASMKTAE